MAKILLNALASTAGGGLTYLRNVLPRLQEYGSPHQFIVLVPEERQAEFVAWQSDSVMVASPLRAVGLGKRLWWEQSALRTFLREQKIDALVSLGNFAMLGAPVPQILFSRNALYFSEHFTRDLLQRGAWKMFVDHRIKSWLAKLSLRVAAYHAVPTAAMGEYLLAAGVAPARLNVLPFGFDASVFVAGRKPLNAAQAAKLSRESEVIRLLYVSHYNYFRNFETLLRALPLLKNAFNQRLELVLTTELKPGVSYGGYSADKACALIEQLGLASNVVMLGAVAYDQLYDVYQACDLFVCPSYAESFGHPLLEAMSAHLPIVAAKLPVHQEICESAALYFDVFDEHELAAQATRILKDASLRAALQAAGQQRIQQFSWAEHVAGLVALVESIIASGKI